MRRQRGEFEKDNLKLHLCNAVFEAYSASYLTTRHHMISGPLSTSSHLLLVTLPYLILYRLCVRLSSGQRGVQSVVGELRNGVFRAHEGERSLL